MTVAAILWSRDQYQQIEGKNVIAGSKDAKIGTSRKNCPRRVVLVVITAAVDVAAFASTTVAIYIEAFATTALTFADFAAAIFALTNITIATTITANE